MEATTMTQEAREAVNAYQRAWKHRHPDKIRQYNINFWNRKALKIQQAVIVEVQQETATIEPDLYSNEQKKD